MMNTVNPPNKRRLFEYKAHEFTSEERRFLATVAWGSIPADELIERSVEIETTRPPEIERVTYLTRELLKQRLFPERRRAYAFAHSYVALVDIGVDFTYIVWDWE